MSRHGQTNRTRSSLLEKIKDPNDLRSWQEFYNLYSRLIYSVALKAGLTDGEAEEVRQETFISVAKKMDQFQYDRNVGSFRGWLIHTAKWRITDQLRKRPCQLRPLKNSGTRTGTGTIERIPDPAGDKLEAIWEAELEQNILGTAVERVKRQVSGKQFQIFELYVLKKWPVLQVARTLRVSVGAVYLAKCRVSRLLKNEVKNLKK
jgi:RNA polymerase sigma factor (sigma-70 family)